jgi:hypothetical protein
MKTKWSVGNNDKKETITPKDGSRGIRTLAVEDLLLDSPLYWWSLVVHRPCINWSLTLNES